MPKFARSNSYNGRQATINWTGDSRFATDAETIAGASNQLAVSPQSLAIASELIVSQTLFDNSGDATLAAGTVVVANTTIAATDKIIISHRAPNASTAIGTLSYTITPGVSFTINSLDATAVLETGDLSSVVYFIIKAV